MKKIKSLTDSKGFTLIELLVVITIIGILATGATAVYSGAQKKARDSIRKSDTTALSNAMDLFAVDNGDTYPGHATATNMQAQIATYLKSTPAPPTADTAGESNAYLVKTNTAKDAYVVAACGMSDGSSTTASAGDIATAGVVILVLVTQELATLESTNIPA